MPAWLQYTMELFAIFGVIGGGFKWWWERRLIFSVKLLPLFGAFGGVGVAITNTSKFKIEIHQVRIFALVNANATDEFIRNEIFAKRYGNIGGEMILHEVLKQLPMNLESVAARAVLIPTRTIQSPHFPKNPVFLVKAPIGRGIVLTHRQWAQACNARIPQPLPPGEA